ncbi:hypothetical protein [Caulobacter sp. UNC279MFTsu5.1]|uniref:hypothetical protein n=1 Tax=Caulobacter sp. UNC279MFTsu5.1 TaxID=1502775 RepID=UPI0008E74987|nr:hypothetical protein [Caulobacter sp. UNC279MFTsu5.1]SFI94506.1 hypothetical protein SAMN02799626_00838 [Caulobacter sp. UNC279MFTsu5.1]
MSPEQKMRDADLELVEVHVANVRRIKGGEAESSKAELNGLVAGAALASRRLSGALVMSRKGLANEAKAAAASEALAANENDIDAKLETEMDDDSGRTPERMAEIHADIRRRLDVARAARESKQMAGRSVAPADRALPSGVEAEGGAPASPA